MLLSGKTLPSTNYQKHNFFWPFKALVDARILQVKCIVVIGHSCCGGIRELLSLQEDRPHTYHFIDKWVKIGLAIKKKEAVNLSLRNLKTYPFVKDKLTNGSLKLIGARYDFVHGTFQTWHAWQLKLWKWRQYVRYIQELSMWHRYSYTSVLCFKVPFGSKC